MRTRVKEQSLSTLIHELDAVFSRFIRTRDTKDGVIRCFICGAKLSFQEAQAMHFIDRDVMPTRHDEINVHAGCEECNCYDPDHKNKYTKKMIVTYTPEQMGLLMLKAIGLQKYMRFEVEELIEHYKMRTNELKKLPTK